MSFVTLGFESQHFLPRYDTGESLLFFSFIQFFHTFFLTIFIKNNVSNFSLVFLLPFSVYLSLLSSVWYAFSWRGVLAELLSLPDFYLLCCVWNRISERSGITGAWYSIFLSPRFWAHQLICHCKIVWLGLLLSLVVVFDTDVLWLKNRIGERSRKTVALFSVLVRSLPLSASISPA